jgi:trans-aconitate methyltransferase
MLLLLVVISPPFNQNCISPYISSSFIMATANKTSVPPNCRFEVDDAEDEWHYSQPFNYIHGRAMFSCFKEPLSVFKKAFDALAPGGYLEMQEIYFKTHSVDGTHEGSALERVCS